MKKIQNIFITVVTFCLSGISVVGQNGSEPSSSALMIPMQNSSVSVLLDPSSTVYFNEDGINGTSNDLTLDLGKIDFGTNKFNKVWVEMSYTGEVADNSKFAFYLDDELMIPNNRLDIPINLPVEDYNSPATPQGGLFFKNKQVETVRVFDVRTDVSISKIVSSALQGILNQEEARVYLYIDIAVR